MIILQLVIDIIDLGVGLILLSDAHYFFMRSTTFNKRKLFSEGLQGRLGLIDIISFFLFTELHSNTFDSGRRYFLWLPLGFTLCHKVVGGVALYDIQDYKLWSICTLILYS